MQTAPRSILHVVDSLEFGGLERVVTDLALAQKASGHTVTVFSILKTDGLARELTQAGIPVLIGHKNGTLDWRVLRALRQAAHKAHVVHAHNFMPGYYTALATLGMWHQPTLVASCHDMGNRLGHARLRRLFSWALTRMARVAMVGQQVRERYVGDGLVDAARADTILNGIPVTRFANSPSRRAAARSALGLKPLDVAIGCVGRLVPLKNHALMINCMPDVLSRVPNAQLVIIGYGEQEAALREQIEKLELQDHVRLAGKRSDVADLLPGFDIFALPSQTEGLSIALLEACATGLAVVASRVGGNPDIVQDGNTGVLVPVDDQSALTNAVCTLALNPEQREQLGANAANWVHNNASVEAMASAYEGFYTRASQPLQPQ